MFSIGEFKRILAISLMLPMFFGTTGAEAQDRPTPSREYIWNNMSVRGTIEAGWRSREVSGNNDVFRTQLNLATGFRLFRMSIEGTPIAETNQFIDGFRINTSSLINEPTQHARVMVRKRGAYQLTTSYRDQKYFFHFPLLSDPDEAGPLPAQHRNDNKRRLLDVNLILTPGQMRFNLGYSRSSLTGPAFSTWDFSRDEFMIFAPSDRTTQDFRVGWDFAVWGIDVSLEQTYRDFENKADYDLARALSIDPQGSLGNNRTPANRTTLGFFERFVRKDGNTPISRVSVQTLIGDRLDLTGRYVFSRGKVDFSGIQFTSGVTFQNRLLVDTTKWVGDTRRPSHLIEVGATYDATSDFRLSDQIRFHKYSIHGRTQETIAQVLDNVPSVTPERFTTDIDLTTLENRLDGEYLLGRRLTIRSGYRFSWRKVAFGHPEQSSARLDTTFVTHAIVGSLGYRVRSGISTFLEYQLGRQDNAFTRIEPLKYQILRFRASYRVSENLSVSGALVLRKTSTPNPDTTENKVKYGTASLSLSYTPIQNAFISIDYNRLNIESETDIRFFRFFVLTRGVSSYGFFNNNFSVDGRVTFWERIGIELSYNFSEATRVSNFPTRFVYFQSKVSMKVIDLIWLNGSYLHYRYDERNSNDQDYKMNGFTMSLSIQL